MHIPTSTDDEDLSINLTPLIDVVFLLLIFFMVTASFQNDERDLAIDVPEAENGNPIADLPETMVVGIRKDGAFTVGGSVLDRDQLRDLLARAKRKNDRQKVIVRADRDAATRHPVSVLDLCAGLSIETALATATRSDG